MALHKRRINYRAKYPDASDTIIEILEKSDRKMEYQQYDLKVERYQVDCTRLTVTCIPSREDSYERLTDESRQFASEEESVEDAAIKAVLIEKMLSSLKLLTPEEQELITELFFNGKSEEAYAKKIGISQKGVNKRKYKILDKIKKMMRI